MTSTENLKFFFFFLSLNKVFSEKPIPYFSQEGENFEIGFCFGVDYIAVYKSGPERDLLLGNSSNMHLTEILPPNLRGRIQLNKEFVLGFQLNNVTELDTGTYRRECWSNQSLVIQNTKHLRVCKQEILPEEIVLNEVGGAELVCNNTSTSRSGVSVRWYYETFQDHNPVLLFDGNVSSKFLTEDLQGNMEVKNNGMVLVLDKTALKSYSQFYCLLFENKKCLGFQNIYQVDSSDSKYIFATEQDREVLECNPEGNEWLWDTPLGTINSSNMIGNQMYVSRNESKLSLVIPHVTDTHSGVYSCNFPLPEIQYILLLCDKTKSGKKDGVKGQNISLECSFPPDVSKNVVWYRREHSERYKIFSDSEDHSLPIPEELKGRLTLSHYEFKLNISEVDTKDAGVYGCAVLATNFIDGEDTNDEEDDSSLDDPIEDWGNELNEKCLFKQETVLKVVKKDSKNIPPPTSEPGKSVNVTGYVVAGVGVGVVVLLVGVMIAVVVKKRNERRNRETGML